MSIQSSFLTILTYFPSSKFWLSIHLQSRSLRWELSPLYAGQEQRQSQLDSSASLSASSATWDALRYPTWPPAASLEESRFSITELSYLPAQCGCSGYFRRGSQSIRVCWSESLMWFSSIFTHLHWNVYRQVSQESMLLLWSVSLINTVNRTRECFSLV